MTHKLNADREMLVAKLSKAIAFIPKKPIIPIWTNFLLSVEAGVLTITASDGVINLRLNCPVDSKSDWKFCAPAGLLFKLISLQKENIVTITMKSEKKIEVKCGKSRSNITLDAFPQDYKVMVMGKITAEINLHQLVLRAAIKNVKGFIDEDSPVDAFQVMNISEITNKMVFTGVSGGAVMCRAAVKPISISQWQPINIHGDTAKRIIGLLGDKGEISVTHCGDKIKFFTDRESPDFFEVISQVSSQKFPNTESVFSKRPEQFVTFNTAEMRDAVKRLSLFRLKADDDPHVAFSNELLPAELMLFTREAMTDREGQEEMTIGNPEKISISKGFSNAFLSQVLGVIEEQESDMFIDPAKPDTMAIIVPCATNEDEDIYMFAIAPRSA